MTPIANFCLYIGDLVSLVECPRPTLLSESVLLDMRQNIESTGRAAAIGRSSLIASQVRHGRLDAVRLVDVMRHDPQLWSLPATQWPLRHLRELVSDVASIVRELQRLEEDPEPKCRSVTLDSAAMQAVDLKVKVTEPHSLLEVAILNALDGKALKVEQLANVVAAGDRSRLYKGEQPLKRLKSMGAIVNSQARGGYYRPDAPPLGCQPRRPTENN